MTRRRNSMAATASSSQSGEGASLSQPHESPRMANLSIRPSNGETPVIANLYQEFYSLLLLYHALCPFNGHHLERQSSTTDELDVRRDFLDSFSYLCDIEKGGKTVTAAALQKLRGRNVLWLAANKDIREEIQVHANWLIETLSKLNKETKQQIEMLIFTRSINVATPRIQFYKSKLIVWIETSVGVLKRIQQDDLVRSLRSQLKELNSAMNSRPSNADLVKLCYEWRGPRVENLRKLCDKNGCFGELAHFIGRLGAHWSSTRTIVDAALRLPSLRRISGIEFAPAQPVEQVNIPADKLDPGALVRNICKKIAHQNPTVGTALYQEWAKVDDLDMNQQDGIRARMVKENPIVTRVHAELVLTDLFSRRGFEFVGSDRYVGCSKPACYFCWNWIDLHHKVFVRPASHNKVILGCRGPDSGLNGNGRRVQEEMYKKMIREVERAIEYHIRERARQLGSIRSHHMSSEGSSRVASTAAGVAV